MNKGVIVVILFFAVIVSVLFVVGPAIETDKLSGLLGVTTFLFGVYSGFTISDRHRRIDALRQNDSIERSSLIHIARLIRAFPDGEQAKIKDAIDQYLIATMDYRIIDYHMTRPQFEKLWTGVLTLKPKNDAQKEAQKTSLGLLQKINEARNQTTSIIEDSMSLFEWVVLYLLSGVIIIIILAGVSSVLSVKALGFVLVIALLVLLAIMHTFDDLSWREEKRIFEPYQKTFEEIGLVAYYPQAVIDRGSVKNHKTRAYRSATYLSAYPDMSNKRIFFVEKGSTAHVPTQKEMVRSLKTQPPQ